MLEGGKIPSFYFDGQVAALLDYLEIRPEKEPLVRKLCTQKKLFVGPFYCLIDEFLTDRACFSKNLEIGMKVALDFGCTDFIGYLADTFGHSQNVPKILLEHGVDKCMVWRGAGKNVPSEFKFNGIDTVNMVRGYFMDIFSARVPVEKKAALLKENLDKIAARSGNILLLPIGADHLGVELDIAEQIAAVNAVLDDYEIVIGSPFDYFAGVKNRFSQYIHEGELRDNSATFILPGCYSARMDLKRYNTECMAALEKAAKAFAHEPAVIDYAYKLLLQNQAHDGICGCSTDLVRRENITRYEKILQITNEINGVDNWGFAREILDDTQRIPVTEDWRCHCEEQRDEAIRTGLPRSLSSLAMTFVRFQDHGDTYNFGAVKNDKGEIAHLPAQITQRGGLTHVKVDLTDTLPDSLYQVKFTLPDPVTETFSEDMNTLIRREFDPSYDIRAQLPLPKKGMEAKTNTAPMQRFVWAQGFGVVTNGLTEYEVCGNDLLITLCRNTGIISNPNNPCRTTPAGPPVPVPDAQCAQTAEFAFGYFDKEDYTNFLL